MSRTRSALVVLASGAATLAVVGVGAGATFTDATHSVQQITAGSIDMQLSSDAGTVSSDGKTLTLPAAGPFNSTFKTDAHTIVIHNAGTVTAQEVFLRASDNTGTGANDGALLREMHVCVYSPSSTNGGPGGVVFDGLLTDLESRGQQVAGSVSPSQTDQYTAEFYAGNVHTACGDESTPSLDNAAEGGVVTPSIDLSYEG